MNRSSFEEMLNAGAFDTPKQRPTLETITAADLLQKEIPPIRFIVDNLLSVGLNILASPPKYGKS